jgi:hypothetical protein
MDEGRMRREKNDLRGALQSFRAANAIMHVPTTGLELARTQAALGLLVEARETIHQFMRTASTNDPPAFTMARASADELDDQLRARIPSLIISLRGATDHGRASVLVDGVTVTDAAYRFGLRLDPGHHVVVARIGTKEAKAEVDLVEKETKEVALDVPSPEPGAEANTPSLPAHVDASTRPVPIPAFILGGVAVLGIGVGTTLALVAKHRQSGLESRCSPRCAPDEVGTVRSTYLAADVSLGVGAAAAIGAAVVYLGRGEASAPSSSTQAARSNASPWMISVAPQPGGTLLEARGKF